MLAVGGSATVSGVNTINVTAIDSSLPTAQTFDLITAASGLTGTYQFSGGGTQKTVTVGGETYTLLLRNADTAVTLRVVAGTPNYLVFVGDNVADGSSTVDLWELRMPTIASPSRS